MELYTYWGGNKSTQFPGENLGGFGVKEIVIDNFVGSNRGIMLVNGNKQSEKTSDILIPDNVTEIWIDEDANIRTTQ